MHGLDVLRYSRFEAPERRLPQAAEDYTRWFLARLRGVDAVVARTEFMCAERFTAADISVGYALLLGGNLRLEPQFPPAVREYWLRLEKRADSAAHWRRRTLRPRDKV